MGSGPVVPDTIAIALFLVGSYLPLSAILSVRAGTLCGLFPLARRLPGWRATAAPFLPPERWT